MTIAPLPAVEAHVTNLFLATNRSFSNLANPSGTSADIESAARRIQYGMSPRAAGDIMLAAKAWVCLSDTDVQYVAASHLQAVVVHALRHRLRLSLDDDHADDVNSDPRYLACSLETKSEIVVPIMHGDTVYGEIDIDSDRPAAFRGDDRALLEAIAPALAMKLASAEARRAPV